MLVILLVFGLLCVPLDAWKWYVPAAILATLAVAGVI